MGSSLRGPQIDRLVREVAERSLEAIRHRLSRRAAAMGAAELRGYLRARAAQPVRVQAREILVPYRLQDKPLEDLVSRALERTIHLLVRESMAQPVVSMPTAHVPLRAAG